MQGNLLWCVNIGESIVASERGWWTPTPEKALLVHDTALCVVLARLSGYLVSHHAITLSKDAVCVACGLPVKSWADCAKGRRL